MLTDDNFDDKMIAEVAAYASVLSNPMRLMIIRKIALENECITSDLQLDLPIKRTTIIQHLQELKNIGILRGNIKGKKLYYCIDYEKLHQIKLFLDSALSLPTPEFNCCVDLIDTNSILPVKS
ncbi:MAG: helix-turn-helix transcriptional regulator [Candidatus Kapabacteria bacterium]|nr:helix-turn-helix transcriptional regulator [Ignavibacteriota bacterium]MCW5884433.1 helix-turn-helix transcriptional regulator [Candidatus Kapabacteria bacterium]